MKPIYVHSDDIYDHPVGTCFTLVSALTPGLIFYVHENGYTWRCLQDDSPHPWRLQPGHYRVVGMRGDKMPTRAQRKVMIAEYKRAVLQLGACGTYHDTGRPGFPFEVVWRLDRCDIKSQAEKESPRLLRSVISNYLELNPSEEDLEKRMRALGFASAKVALEFNNGVYQADLLGDIMIKLKRPMKTTFTCTYLTRLIPDLNTPLP